MQIQTFKKEVYRAHPIYFRRWGRHFEYLTVLKGEIYTTHISVKPTAVNLLLKALKIEKSEFSEQQTGAIIKQLRHMAQATIDTVLEQDKIRAVGDAKIERKP